MMNFDYIDYERNYKRNEPEEKRVIQLMPITKTVYEDGNKNTVYTIYRDCNGMFINNIGGVYTTSNTILKIILGSLVMRGITGVEYITNPSVYPEKTKFEWLEGER